MLPAFDRSWDEAGLTDTDLSKFQAYMLANPKSGDVVQGLTGLRKLRWKLPGRGKRGSIRVFYLDLERHQVLFFLAVLQKSQKSDLAPIEVKLIKNLIVSIKGAYSRRRDDA